MQVESPFRVIARSARNRPRSGAGPCRRGNRVKVRVAADVVDALCDHAGADVAISHSILGSCFRSSLRVFNHLAVCDGAAIGAQLALPLLHLNQEVREHVLGGAHRAHSTFRRPKRFLLCL